mmetsp:Transcript_85901/g.179559  ORF Transcript_85901/g.179559 Transcript_85901/m.179559 type:complete len:254 (-) Transcript_85901:202-963(-)
MASSIQNEGKTAWCWNPSLASGSKGVVENLEGPGEAGEVADVVVVDAAAVVAAAVVAVDPFVAAVGVVVVAGVGGVAEPEWVRHSLRVWWPIARKLADVVVAAGLGWEAEEEEAAAAAYLPSLASGQACRGSRAMAFGQRVGPSLPSRSEAVSKEQYWMQKKNAVVDRQCYRLGMLHPLVLLLLMMVLLPLLQLMLWLLWLLWLSRQGRCREMSGAWPDRAAPRRWVEVASRRSPAPRRRRAGPRRLGTSARS